MSWDVPRISAITRALADHAHAIRVPVHMQEKQKKVLSAREGMFVSSGPFMDNRRIYRHFCRDSGVTVKISGITAGITQYYGWLESSINDRLFPMAG